MKQKEVNRWKKHHESLPDKEKVAARDRLQKLCEWSQATFYRRMENPNGLRFWQQKFVAIAYGKEIEELFPESEKTAA